MISKTRRISNAHGFFGVLLNAGSGDWGTRIMLLHNQHAPENELERLLRTSGGGVGCLQFSLSRNRLNKPAPLPDIFLIEKLVDVIHRVESKSLLTEDELALI